MRVLNFKVDQQIIKKDGDFSNIVKGSSGYLTAQFLFSPDWSGLKVCASFFTNGQEYAVPIVKNHSVIPDQVTTEDYFRVQVCGIKNGQIIKTNKVLVRQEG